MTPKCYPYSSDSYLPQNKHLYQCSYYEKIWCIFSFTCFRC